MLSLKDHMTLVILYVVFLLLIAGRPRESIANQPAVERASVCMPDKRCSEHVPYEETQVFGVCMCLVCARLSMGEADSGVAQW